MAAASYFSIASFFEGELKLIKRGENALGSDRLLSFVFDGSCGVIVASVKASMKDRRYEVRVSSV